jgi:hypothetical protein
MPVPAVADELAARGHQITRRVRQLHGLRLRPVHLAPRRSGDRRLRGGQRLWRRDGLASRVLGSARAARRATKWTIDEHGGRRTCPQGAARRTRCGVPRGARRRAAGVTFQNLRRAKRNTGRKARPAEPHERTPKAAGPQEAPSTQCRPPRVARSRDAPQRGRCAGGSSAHNSDPNDRIETRAGCASACPCSTLPHLRTTASDRTERRRAVFGTMPAGCAAKGARTPRDKGTR